MRYSCDRSQTTCDLPHSFFPCSATMTSYLTSLSAWRQQPIPVASGSKKAPFDLNAQIAATPSFQFQDDTPPASDEEDEAIPSDEEPSFPAKNSAQRQNGLGLPHSTNAVPKKPRRKVALEPGYSQLDWAKLKSSGKDLRVCSVCSWQ